jgi:hypothetical protein
LAVIAFFIIISRVLAWRFIKNCFYEGNVIVTGLRGRGKDVLFSLVTNSNKCKYISNVDYTADSRYIPFSLDDISVGGNTYLNFIKGDIKPYEYPFPDGLDYYISDSGIYFPSQEFSSLNRWFPSVPVFQALSRHLGDCNFHCNVQNLNRLWDKIREQADSYILCRSCKVFFHHFVTMTVYYYDRYQSCVDRVKPMKRSWGRLGKIEFDKFTATYGTIKKLKIWGFLRHDYDSRIFKTILRGSKNEEKTKTNLD